MKSDFIIALTQLAAERNLPRGTVISAIEAALASAYKKDSISTGQNISVNLDPGTGEISAHIVKNVVETPEDPELEISLSEAKKINSEAEIGATIQIEELTNTAGRMAAQTAKQVILQMLRAAENEIILKEFENKEGEVFSIVIQKIEKNHIIADIGRTEAILPTSEQSPNEKHRVGQKLKVVLKSIRPSTRGPEIIISRADGDLLKRLFEMEVPEIYDNLVQMVEVAREAGSRSKISVFAKQEGIDAVGSCVGLRGVRIQNIVNELQGEKIDVVEWNKDPKIYITNALSPATIQRVIILPDKQSAIAIVPENEISLAIGKDGQNVRLAAKLTGWKLDIKSSAESLDLDNIEEPEIETEIGPEIETPLELGPDDIEKTLEEIQEGIKIPAENEDVSEEQLIEEPAAENEDVSEEQLIEDLIEESIDSSPITESEEQSEKTESTSIEDLPTEIWSLNAMSGEKTNSIRFAEDIDELGRSNSPGAKSTKKKPQRNKNNKKGR
ncbi:MAG: transcription termination/antitermination protein NusA [Chloroflexi bacterium]|nr:transcription termination/antitermination protein NusA [Chloroflexota bacterium]